MDGEWLEVGRNAIRLEAQALSSFVDILDEGFETACKKIRECQGTVLVTGMGKSGLVARKLASTFSGTGTKSFFINPAEAPHGDLGMIHQSDVVIALSLSGETEELSYILRHARELGVFTIAITANRESSLAKRASLLLSIELPKEACPLGLAPTTSTTLMMALGDALAVTIMEMRGFTREDFARLHPGGTLGRRLWLRVNELMHQGDAIPRVDPEAPLDEVLIEITSKRLGMAVVIDGEKVLGIVTDGDLRRHFQSKGMNGSVMAKELMTTLPKSIGSMALAIEARELMEAHKVQQLLVLDEDQRLKGIVHFHDLLRAKVL